MTDATESQSTNPDEEFQISADRIHRDFIQELMFEYLSDQKRERRWKSIKRIFISIMIAAGLFVYAGTLAGSLGYRVLPTNDTVAVVPVSGVIGQDSDASAESVITVLERLFDTETVNGIILVIDSGGGSPTEAERITRFIDSEKERTGKPVIAVCASMCASAAYMIALHADQIYAGEYSWTGSIGAIMKGWNFRALMERVDIDQRVFASGPLKDLMNPFADMSPEMSSKLASLVDATAETFKHEVQKYRGDRLSGQENLFTGEVWSGPRSVDLGLVDKLGTVETVLAEHFSGIPSAVYRPKRRNNTLFDKVLGNVGRGIAETLLRDSQGVQM